MIPSTIKTIRRVVRAKAIVVPGALRNGEYPMLERTEYTLTCGHKRVEKRHAGRKVPLKMQCKEC